MNKKRYIDLNKLTARLPVLNDNGEYLVAISDVRRAISLARAETGEVVEVVRCKDCCHTKPYILHGYLNDRLIVCFRDDLLHEKNNFCSAGKRKTDRGV